VPTVVREVVLKAIVSLEVIRNVALTSRIQTIQFLCILGLRVSLLSH